MQIAIITNLSNFLPGRIDDQKVNRNPWSNEGKANGHTPEMVRNKIFERVYLMS